MIKNRDFLLSELFGRQALNFDERAKIDFHTVLLSYIVIKTTGCKDKYAVALLMCVNLTYVLAAFIASIVLLPLLVYFTKQLRLEYIPRLDDYLISFIIFSAIMLISTLPGLKRTVRNPLRKRGG